MRQRKTHDTRRGFAALLLNLCAIVSTLAVALPAKAAAQDIYVPKAPADKGSVATADTLDEAAKLLTGGGNIYLTADASVDTATFAGGIVTISSYGETAHTVTKSGEGANMLMLSGNADVTLKNVVFDASGNVNGRTVHATGGSTLTLGEDAVLQNNTVYGAVYLDGSILNVEGGAIRDNHAVTGDVKTKSRTVAGSYSGYTYTAEYGERQPLGGAVLMVNESSFKIHSGELSGNTALSGGAVFASNLNSMSLSGGKISDNKTDFTTEGKKLAHGGAISIENSEKCSVVIEGAVSIQNNTCGWNGAGLYLDHDVGAVDLTMTGGTFSANHAGRNGATICSLAYNPVVDIGGASVFKDNQSDAYGGLYFTKAEETQMPDSDRGVLKIVGSGVSFSGNSATYGSCLSVTKNGAINDITLEGCTFEGNTAESNSGGACYLNVASGTITMKDVTYTGNKTERNGGAFYAGLTSSALTVDGGTYTKNFAGFSGGAFYAQIDKNSSVTVQGKARFEENEANVNAGAFSLKRAALGNGGTVQLLECDVLNNQCNAIFEGYTGTDLEPTKHYNTGGIYVGEDVTCYMYDALITKNYVQKGYLENESGNGIVGSGIALCPNAEVYLFQEHGATIYGNGAENTMDILAVPSDPVITHETPAKLYVSDIAPDGRPYKWEDLNGDKARTGQYDWTNVFNGIATAAAFEDGSSGETSSAPVGFRANLEDVEVRPVALSASESEYKVIIMDNSTAEAAYGGGGVMVNGKVIAGDLAVSIQKEVKGLSTDKVSEKEFQFTFSITEQKGYNTDEAAKKEGFNSAANIDIKVTETGELESFKREIKQSEDDGKYYPVISHDFTIKGAGSIQFENFKFKKDGEDTTIFNKAETYEFHLEEIENGGATKTVIKWEALGEGIDNRLGYGTGNVGTLTGTDTVKTIKFTAINLFPAELDLSKKVSTGVETGEYWTFEITLNVPDYDNDPNDTIKANGKYDVELLNGGEIAIGDNGKENDLELEDGKGTLQFKDGKATVSLKHNQTLKIKGLLPGSKYTIKETTGDGYTSSQTDSGGGTIPDEGGTVEVVFTNTPLVDLTVKKTVTGVGTDLTEEEKNKEFKFTVEMTPNGDASLDDVTYSGSASATREGNKWTFNLKHDDNITFSKIPVGTTYTVTETHEDGYSATVGSGAVTDDGGVSVNGTIKADDNTLEFTNKHVPGPEKSETKAGTTEVTPPISDGKGPEVKVGDEITYEITWANDTSSTAEVKVEDKLDKGVDFVKAAILDEDGNEEEPTLEGAGTSTDGKITYDADSRTVTWTLDGCAAGASGKVRLVVRVNDSAVMHWDYNGENYLVDPTENDSADYEVVDKARVTVTGHTPKVTSKITNPLKPGSLTVTKTVTGDGADKDKQFDFTVTLKPKPGVTLTYKVDGADNGITWEPEDIDVTRVDNTLTFKLAHGQHVTFTGIPAGTEYTVTETRADGYSATVVGGAVTPDGGASVDGEITTDGKTHEFINRRLPGPEKTETDPGDGVMVDVGKTITYEITWENYLGKAADIVVTDKLDPGVDFVSAGYKEGTPKGGTPVHDDATHMVTWTLKAQPQGTTGVVTLTVRVNEKAVQHWDYDAKYDDTDSTKTDDAKGKDLLVRNQAKVQVDNDAKVTRKVENPVPEKEEMTPGAGEMAGVGEEITYRIHWKNGHDQPATVTITDALDEGLDFVSASDVYSYNRSTHTVTWLLKDCAAGAEGYVELTATVNEKALKTWTYDDDATGGKPGDGEDYKVVNQALVQVGDDPQVKTQIIPNPNKPGKVETDPGDGVTVQVGQVITYQIAWVNSAHDEVTGQPVAAEDVTVTDPLDDGVDYVDSAPRGVYDQTRHAVVWDLGPQDADAHGVVTLKVRVNERAIRHWAYGEEMPDGEIDVSEADGTTDDQVVDRAYVQVNHGPKVYTQTVRNPLKPGALAVRKTVEGDGGSQTAFNFRVELSNKSISGRYGDMTFTDGVAAFALKNGESRTATGLPAGTGYTVTEAEANLNGYATAATGAQGVIPEGDTALASFVNRYSVPDVPVTGDESRPLLWAALACVCALGALLLARRLRGEG